MNYIVSFFRTEVLFNLRPAPLAGLGLKILVSGYGALIVLALVTGSVAKRRVADVSYNKGIKKIRNIFWTVGILGLVYTFFAYEGAVFLSARFWVVVLLAIMLVWFIFPLKYLLREIPVMKAEAQRKREVEKYLPR